MSFLIKLLNFNNFSNLDWHNNFLLDKQGVPCAASGGGLAVVSKIEAKGIYQWEGFELEGESDIEVAIFPEFKSPEMFDSPSFDSNYNEYSEPWQSGIQWRTPSEVRELLESWGSDKIQIVLKIPEGVSLSDLKIGIWIAESQIDYILNYALPHVVSSVPFTLVRWVKIGSDGLTIPLPPNLNTERFLKVICNGQNVQIQASNLRLLRPVPQGTTGKLIITTTIKFAPIKSNSSYQISELPTVLIRLSERNKQSFNPSAFEQSITVPTGKRKTRTEYWIGQILEVSVFAESLADRQIIADYLMGFFSGCDLPLPLFGERIPIQVISSGREIPNIGNQVAVIPALQFEICVWGIPVGQRDWLELF